MTTKASTGLRNHVLVTGSARAGLANGFLDIYGGPEPATADAAIDPATQILLVRIYSDGTSTGINLAATAADGFVEKAAEAWTGTVIESGRATFFRLVGAADTGVLSTTQPRLQGSVARAGGDLNLSDVELVAGDPQAVNYFTVALPAF
ncbi:MAG: hypothetical protein LBE61_09750 [Burkholderiaceae bacterium]|jgi:hypothetical protein|nr:hypothetical protein [Burkholderiaceae bacterium]